MKRWAATLLTLFGATLACSNAGAADSAPQFREVFELLRTNLTGLTEAELNQAAVSGLLGNLRGRASLVGAAQSTKATPAKFSVFDGSVAVARVGQLNSQLADELAANFQELSASNKLKGLVLDLRFTASDDYAAAVSVAELFVPQDRALLDWGSGLVKSRATSVAIDLPVAVLVNRETLGAPEALAGALRETGVALILGNTTAGRAQAGRKYDLSGGHKLWIASTPVKLADGSEIPATGLTPDITVDVTTELEKSLIAEPYGPAPGVATPTNVFSGRPARSRRPSEAELVRERREATNELDLPLVRESPPPRPVILDPVLARAVDLLKGLARIRGDRS